MGFIKTLTVFFFAFVLVGLAMIASPNRAGAQVMEFGCCQFFVDGEPGCIYPTSSKDCKGEGKTYINDGLCITDTGYCTGYSKDESKDSKKDK